MEEMTVQSNQSSYPIYIGQGLRYQLSSYIEKKYTKLFIITDDQVGSRYLKDVLHGYPSEENICHFTIPSGESSKSIDNFYRLQTEALQNGLDRHSLIIALGGGVVGDLAGLVAATFMRGIDYIQVPTTILAHDSSVGGKVAINHHLGKNLIGSFFPPVAVIYDIETLSTLPPHEIRSGYAEIVKEGLIANQKMFLSLLDHSLASIKPHQLEIYLKAGIQVKSRIVEQDEKEANIRKFLNLGHTLGHALETIHGYGNITHGEAVANGLLFALHVSEYEFEIQLPFYQLYQWLKDNEYPILSFSEEEITQLIELMKTDKKSVGGTIQMVLLKEVEDPVTVSLDNSMMKQHLSTYLERMEKL
ncbi:3-dehydroquinate synthase [Oceanobacillus iheyensis]|uniref:3-dehydroquinate synthase n=1 Tax=Oceanobacillus iheyensis (strain DSM 14371 / CIP 107618 / JCM 11309 / KCTC 3954 / HTE831) TaxID=221109 RepID=AROB_OCEIH|nr:3-dehydroquinate synthase [Oceanobacillus iheyensis]Q8EQB7.1 RecName: Full=3-dehydroquinate synthase; Short=DHQS [Oceanobacillus iheyensis HTE831]BAC13740.1 3-dehydroquinate synthase [Oceanobacillus iheyensis HTE831]